MEKEGKSLGEMPAYWKELKENHTKYLIASV